jgi:hypothetical protein
MASQTMSGLAGAFAKASATVGFAPPPGGYPGILVAQKPKKPKKEKKPKDPNAPKRPLSSYLLFCAQERPKVTASNPEMKGRDVMTELGARWGRLADEAKKPFKDEAEKLAAEYAAAVEVYKGTGGAGGGGSIVGAGGIVGVGSVMRAGEGGGAADGAGLKRKAGEEDGSGAGGKKQKEGSDTEDE